MDVEGVYIDIFKVNILILIGKFTGLFPDCVNELFL
jgi:hypothetical protein